METDQLADHTEGGLNRRRWTLKQETRHSRMFAWRIVCGQTEMETPYHTQESGVGDGC